eukprot:EG_transcript_2757
MVITAPHLSDDDGWMTEEFINIQPCPHLEIQRRQKRPNATQGHRYRIRRRKSPRYTIAHDRNLEDVQADWLLLHDLKFFQYISGLESYLPDWAADAEQKRVFDQRVEQAIEIQAQEMVKRQQEAVLKELRMKIEKPAGAKAPARPPPVVPTLPPGRSAPNPQPSSSSHSARDAATPTLPSTSSAGSVGRASVGHSRSSSVDSTSGRSQASAESTAGGWAPPPRSQPMFPIAPSDIGPPTEAMTRLRPISTQRSPAFRLAPQPARPLALPPGCSARPEVTPSGWQAMADPSGSARPTTYTDLAVARGLIPSRSPVADSIPRPPGLFPISPLSGGDVPDSLKRLWGGTKPADRVSSPPLTQSSYLKPFFELFSQPAAGPSPPSGKLWTARSSPLEDRPPPSVSPGPPEREASKFPAPPVGPEPTPRPKSPERLPADRAAKVLPPSQISSTASSPLSPLPTFTLPPPVASPPVPGKSTVSQLQEEVARLREKLQRATRDVSLGNPSAAITRVSTGSGANSTPSGEARDPPARLGIERQEQAKLKQALYAELQFVQQKQEQDLCEVEERLNRLQTSGVGDLVLEAQSLVQRAVQANTVLSPRLSLLELDTQSLSPLPSNHSSTSSEASLPSSCLEHVSITPRCPGSLAPSNPSTCSSMRPPLAQSFAPPRLEDEGPSTSTSAEPIGRLGTTAVTVAAPRRLSRLPTEGDPPPSDGGLQLSPVSGKWSDAAGPSGRTAPVAAAATLGSKTDENHVRLPSSDFPGRSACESLEASSSSQDRGMILRTAVRPDLYVTAADDLPAEGTSRLPRQAAGAAFAGDGVRRATADTALEPPGSSRRPSPHRAVEVQEGGCQTDAEAVVLATPALTPAPPPTPAPP